MRSPPTIQHIHFCVRDNRENIIDDLSNVLRLTRTEKKLITLYAGSTSGFKPSIELIMSRTGCGRRQLFEARNTLQRLGVIRIDSNSLYLDWKKIKAIASLDNKLAVPTGKNGKRCVARINPSRTIIDNAGKEFDAGNPSRTIIEYSGNASNPNRTIIDIIGDGLSAFSNPSRTIIDICGKMLQPTGDCDGDCRFSYLQICSLQLAIDCLSLMSASEYKSFRKWLAR